MEGIFIINENSEEREGSADTNGELYNYENCFKFGVSDYCPGLIWNGGVGLFSIEWLHFKINK